MTTSARTAIFPVAGQGTRLLPATKSVPKELLPVFDTPLLHFALEEARGAGVERLVFVSHPSKSAIHDYLSTKPELAASLRAQGKHDLAASVQGVADGLEVVFTMQPAPRGLGHAVLCARDHVLPGPVAIILPDDLILGPSCLSEMADAYADLPRGHLVAAMEVSPRDVSKYGMLDVLRNGRDARVVQALGIVEKPALGTAPSSLAVVGRYILHPCIFDDLAATRPGAGGEIQLTDAIGRGIERVGLSGFRFSGTRHDCGNPEGLLGASIAYHDICMRRASRLHVVE